MRPKPVALCGASVNDVPFRTTILPHGATVIRYVCLLLMALVLPVPAFAGPPYVTDDPEPTDTGHWEVFNFAAGTAENGTNFTQMGVDLNYGPVKDVQLTATLPLQTGTDLPLGASNIEIAGKYRFLHRPGLDVALFPRAFLPTARGPGQTQLLLPIWAEHDWGPWSLFGGGGYTLNLGTAVAGNRNFWQQGAALTRLMRPGFSMGAEYYGQGAASIGSRAVQGVNVGTQIHLRGPFSLLGSFGQGLSRRQTIFYTALKLDL